MKIIFSENIYPKLVGYRQFLNPDEPGEICHNISQYLEASMTSYNATLMMNNNGHQNNYQDYLYMTLYIAGDANDFNSQLMCKLRRDVIFGIKCLNVVNGFDCPFSLQRRRCIIFIRGVVFKNGLHFQISVLRRRHAIHRRRVQQLLGFIRVQDIAECFVDGRSDRN